MAGCREELKKKRIKERKGRDAGESIKSGKNGASALGRKWTYQTTYVSHKILGGYFIQSEEHFYGV